jgi:cytochrome P450
MEAIRIPGLLSSLREEISTAIKHSKTATKTEFDITKLISLPLLSSVYTETLRLRVSTTLTRLLISDLEVDGLTLKKGNMVMIPSLLAHTDASEWLTPEHPATEFWPQRFLPSKFSDGDSTTPKPGTFFPFGGGISICPGRVLAKQEILTAVAMLIWKLEFEFVEFVTEDGKTHDRGPEAPKRAVGAGSVVPDGDLKVRLRRR